MVNLKRWMAKVGERLSEKTGSISSSYNINTSITSVKKFGLIWETKGRGFLLSSLYVPQAIAVGALLSLRLKPVAARALPTRLSALLLFPGCH